MAVQRYRSLEWTRDCYSCCSWQRSVFGLISVNVIISIFHEDTEDNVSRCVGDTKPGRGMAAFECVIKIPELSVDWKQTSGWVHKFPAFDGVAKTALDNERGDLSMCVVIAVML